MSGLGVREQLQFYGFSWSPVLTLHRRVNDSCPAKVPGLWSDKRCFLFVLIRKIQEKKTSPYFLLAKFCHLAMPGLHCSAVCWVWLLVHHCWDYFSFQLACLMSPFWKSNDKIEWSEPWQALLLFQRPHRFCCLENCILSFWKTWPA